MIKVHVEGVQTVGGTFTVQVNPADSRAGAIGPTAVVEDMLDSSIPPLLVIISVTSSMVMRRGLQHLFHNRCEGLMRAVPENQPMGRGVAITTGRSPACADMGSDKTTRDEGA